VSAFHLHARLVEGALGTFTRNESRAETADTWAAATAVADDLCRRGFTVWIYEHGAPSPLLTASDLRVVACRGPQRD
jgi:hypothetical protein